MTFVALVPEQHSSPASELRPDRIGWRWPVGPDRNPKSRRADEPSSMDTASIVDADARAILFGRFRLVLKSRELLADDVPVPIGGRAADVLMVLIEARGELVTKDELLSRVWPTMTVEENNLQFQI